jgi:hypothetical protein
MSGEAARYGVGGRAAIPASLKPLEGKSLGPPGPNLPGVLSSCPLDNHWFGRRGRCFECRLSQ